MDAVCYLCLANIFTAHVTGNAVGFGAAAGAGDWRSAAPRLLPLPMFVLGIVVGTWLVHASKQRNLRSPHTATLLSELVLLVLVAAMGGRFTVGRSQNPLEHWQFLVCISCAALAMGLQNAISRYVAGNTVRTTFITGTLIDLTESATSLLLSPSKGVGGEAAEQRRKAARRARLFSGVLAAFVLGAVLGGAAGVRFHLQAVLLPAAGLAVITAFDRHWG